MAESPKRSPRGRGRGSAPAGGTADDAIATPRDEPEAREVAAGPTSATRGRRRAERPIASPGSPDATAPTSGTRSGPTGTTAGGGAAKGGGATRGRGTAKSPSSRAKGQTSADSGGSTTAAPTMPGPTGPAQTTELVGDPGAAPPRRAEPDTAPLRPAVADRHDVVEDEPMATNEGPFPTPGGGGTGPIDPIYDVERVQRTLARRAGDALRSPTARR